MNDNHVRELWHGLNGAIYSVERDRCVGEFADDRLIVDLANRVIREIDALPAQSSKMLERREMAESIVAAYSPMSYAPAREYVDLGLDVLQRA
jgi:hypothetical protein